MSASIDNLVTFDDLNDTIKEILIATTNEFAKHDEIFDNKISKLDVVIQDQYSKLEAIILQS